MRSEIADCLKFAAFSGADSAAADGGIQFVGRRVKRLFEPEAGGCQSASRSVARWRRCLRRFVWPL